MQFGFLGLLPAFFFSSIVPSLKADEVSENTLSPVEGGPIIEHPVRTSVANSVGARLDCMDIVVSSVWVSLPRIVSPQARHRPLPHLTRRARAQRAQLLLEIADALEQRDREREPLEIEVEIPAQPEGAA